MGSFSLSVIVALTQAFGKKRLKVFQDAIGTSACDHDTLQGLSVRVASFFPLATNSTQAGCEQNFLEIDTPHSNMFSHFQGFYYFDDFFV